MKYDFYLVIDLEATCDNGGAVPKQQMEIIEVGAVLADARTLQPVEELQTFVKPVRHPVLTPFCTELTSITQDMVEAAPGFQEAMERLGRFIDRRRVRFCSWGRYDCNQFLQDARHHGVRLPFGTEDHLNLKRAFSDQLRTKKRFGMAGALKRVGLKLDGTHHRGIDDARNITKLLPYCLGKQPFPKARHGSGRSERRARG